MPLCYMIFSCKCLLYGEHIPPEVIYFLKQSLAVYSRLSLTWDSSGSISYVLELWV